MIGAAFAPDGSFLVTCTGQAVCVWDWTGKQRRNAPARGRLFTSVAVSRCGTRLATGSEDGLVVLWDAYLVPLHTWYYLTGGTHVSCFGETAGRVVVRCSDGAAAIADEGSDSPMRLAVGHPLCVDALGGAEDGRRRVAIRPEGNRRCVAICELPPGSLEDAKADVERAAAAALAAAVGARCLTFRVVARSD